MLFAYSD